MGRPKASVVWTAIQRSLSGDFSAMEGRDGPVSIPRLALPFFWLACLANGNFIAPRAFSKPSEIPLAASKGLAVVGSVLWAFAALPQYRLSIGLFLASYAVYFRLYVLPPFNAGWKITSPIRPNPQTELAAPIESSVSVTVAGFRSCPYYRRALAAAQDMVKKGLTGEVVDRTFDSRKEFQEWLLSKQGRCQFGHRAREHSSSPFVWTGDNVFLGGCDDLLRLIERIEASRL